MLLLRYYALITMGNRTLQCLSQTLDKKVYK
jgi:hypothetical protein